MPTTQEVRRLLPEIAAHLMTKHRFHINDGAYIKLSCLPGSRFGGCPIGALLYEEHSESYGNFNPHEFFVEWTGSAGYALGYDIGFHNRADKCRSDDEDEAMLWDLGHFDGRSARVEIETPGLQRPALFALREEDA